VIHTGDCVEVMAGMEPESVDAIVTDPPYGLEFMGKEWDRLDWRDGGGFSKPGIGDRPTAWTSFGGETANPTCATCGGRARGARKCSCEAPDWRVKGETMTDRTAARSRLMQEWHQAWATAALRVAKPGAYLLAFGGTRTFHRLAVAIEDAGWIIRDTLVWAYASGFPKSKASLKPAWEPIVMARKPGPLRDLDIEGCRIGTEEDLNGGAYTEGRTPRAMAPGGAPRNAIVDGPYVQPAGRWPANVILTDPIFDGGWDGVVGGGEAGGGYGVRGGREGGLDFGYGATGETVGYGDTGTYSRFFIIPKASRGDREPLVAGELEPAFSPTMGNGIGAREHDPAIVKAHRRNTHPTVKPVELMRHLVRLVTPQGGTVLDPFLGSGSTGVAAEQEGFDWIGIEREAEYVAIARQRLVDVQSGLGLDVPAPVTLRTTTGRQGPDEMYRSPHPSFGGFKGGEVK
jgi:DNA modification methylase